MISSTMDASIIFNELIHKIEKSKLNYIISKTPFSAQISIKRSFVKFFAPPSQIQAEATLKQDPADLRKVEVTKLQEQENKHDQMLNF